MQLRGQLSRGSAPCRLQPEPRHSHVCQALSLPRTGPQSGSRAAAGPTPPPRAAADAKAKGRSVRPAAAGKGKIKNCFNEGCYGPASARAVHWQLVPALQNGLWK